MLGCTPAMRMDCMHDQACSQEQDAIAWLYAICATPLPPKRDLNRQRCRGPHSACEVQRRAVLRSLHGGHGETLDLQLASVGCWQSSSDGHDVVTHHIDAEPASLHGPKQADGALVLACPLAHVHERCEDHHVSLDACMEQQGNTQYRVSNVTDTSNNNIMQYNIDDGCKFFIF